MPVDEASVFAPQAPEHDGNDDEEEGGTYEGEARLADKFE